MEDDEWKERMEGDGRKAIVGGPLEEGHGKRIVERGRIEGMRLEEIN